MKNRILFLLFCLALAAFSACTQAELTNRVQITDQVSVLMPQEVQKTESDGLLMYLSEIGSTRLMVSVVTDQSLEGMGIDQRLEAMELNVARFLQPRNGKLLDRKDAVVNGWATSDFDFETGPAGSEIYGVGRFIVKDNQFIGFLAESPTKGAKTDVAWRESFFNSIQIN